MRSESEMLELILQVARRHETVRAVILQGSRANPFVVKDKWQDYDVLFLVEDLEKLSKDQHWLAPFGERLIMQTPENIWEALFATTSLFEHLSGEVASFFSLEEHSEEAQRVRRYLRQLYQEAIN